MNKIEIRIDPDRMNKLVSVDDYIALVEERSIKGIRNVVSHFVIEKSGEYMKYEKALRLIGSLNLEQLLKLGEDFTKASEVAADAGPKEQTEPTEPTSPD